MKIEIVVDLSKPPPLASRVAPAPVATNGAQTPAPRSVDSIEVVALRVLILWMSYRVGGTRGRRARVRGGARKAPKTAADLDAEMEVCTVLSICRQPSLSVFCSLGLYSQQWSCCRCLGNFYLFYLFILYIVFLCFFFFCYCPYPPVSLSNSRYPFTLFT